MIKWSLPQGCKDSSISADQSVWYSATNQLKNKNPTVISIDSEKAFEKIQHPFLIKILQKVSIEWTYCNIIKAMDDKATENNTLNDEKLKAFPLR